MSNIRPWILLRAWEHDVFVYSFICIFIISAGNHFHLNRRPTFPSVDIILNNLYIDIC